MSEMKHTKGPWMFDTSYAWTERELGGKRVLNTHYRVTGPNGDGWTPIAVCSSNAKATDNEANAKLIAATPDLFQVALAYLGAFETHRVTNTSSANGLDVTGHIADLARAAIAKALGEHP
jgi:hypothetical protein